MQFKLRQDVFLAEISLDPFYEALPQRARAAQTTGRFRAFPSVERDFALILNDGTAFAAVRDALKRWALRKSPRSRPSICYRGKKMPAGKFSLLVRVTFQSQDDAHRSAGERFLRANRRGARAAARRGAAHLLSSRLQRADLVRCARSARAALRPLFGGAAVAHNTPPPRLSYRDSESDAGAVGQHEH